MIAKLNTFMLDRMTGKVEVPSKKTHAAVYNACVRESFQLRRSKLDPTLKFLIQLDVFMVSAPATRDKMVMVRAFKSSLKRFGFNTMGATKFLEKLRQLLKENRIPNVRRLGDPKECWISAQAVTEAAFKAYYAQSYRKRKSTDKRTYINKVLQQAGWSEAATLSAKQLEAVERGRGTNAGRTVNYNMFLSGATIEFLFDTFGESQYASLFDVIMALNSPKARIILKTKDPSFQGSYFWAWCAAHHVATGELICIEYPCKRKYAKRWKNLRGKRKKEKYFGSDSGSASDFLDGSQDEEDDKAASSASVSTTAGCFLDEARGMARKLEKEKTHQEEEPSDFGWSSTDSDDEETQRRIAEEMALLKEEQERATAWREQNIQRTRALAAGLPPGELQGSSSEKGTSSNLALQGDQDQPL